MAATNQEVIEMLKEAYCMELETVMNYLANSTNLDGVRAEEIKKSLAADVTEELLHAQQLGKRIKQIGGLVPGSASVGTSESMQLPELRVERLEIDSVGIKEPLQEDSVHRRHRENRQTPALARIPDDATQACLVQFTDVTVELLKPGAELRACLHAFEDQIENEAAQLGTLTKRLREESPAGLRTLIERWQREDLPHRPVRDLLENPLCHPQEQLFLRSEVPEYRALRDADFLSQMVKGGSLYAAGREHSQRGLENRFLGADAALLAGTLRRTPGVGGRARAGSLRMGRFWDGAGALR